MGCGDLFAYTHANTRTHAATYARPHADSGPHADSSAHSSTGAHARLMTNWKALSSVAESLMAILLSS